METNAIRRLVSLIFPASCLGCSTELGQSAFAETAEDENATALGFMGWQHAHWCEGCWQKLSIRGQSRCHRCCATLFLSNPFDDECKLCHGTDLRFKRAIAVGNYQGLLQELIIRMKGQQDEALAIQLGQMLGYELLAADWPDFDLSDFDLAIPVPSHWFRKLKRGFQAADVICESLCGLTGIKKSSSIVKAKRSTKKQGTLSSAGRFSNVRGAFSIRPTEQLQGKRLIIVDDVMTSGATTSEIARILLANGAKEVYVAVVARGARVS